MKKLITILLIATAISTTMNTSARELKVESFALISGEQTAQTSPRQDLNGDDCALVKVDFPVAGCQFDGAVGDVAYVGGTYHLYLSPGTRRISVKCPDHDNLAVDLRSISEVASLETAKTYLLKLLSIDNSKAMELADLAGNDGLKVEKFELLPSDISARTNERRDADNERCALIKVALPVPGCEFAGNLGNAAYNVNEYAVYVSPKTDELVIDCPGFYNDTISFGSYINGRLESGATYRLVMSGYNTSLVNFTPEFERLLQQYDVIDDFIDGIARVKENDKYGVINTAGTEIVPPIYDVLSISEEFPYIYVILEGKEGLLSRDCTELLPCRYDDIRYFGDKIWKVSVGEKWGLVTVDGIEILPCKLSYISSSVRDGMTKIEQDDKKYGYVNNSTGEVISCQYDRAFEFKDGYAVVELNSESAVIDKKGRLIIPFGKYDYLSNLGEGLVSIGREIMLPSGKTRTVYGCVTISGAEVVAFKYDSIDEFDDGVAKVKKEGKYGFINNNGEEIIPPVYDAIISDRHRFKSGLVVGKRDGKYGLINRKGQEVTYFEYEEIYSDYDEGEPAYSNGKNGYSIKLEGKYGYLDANGKEILSCKYDRIKRGRDMLFVAIDDKWGLYTLQGNQVIPCKYDNIYFFWKDLAVVSNNDKSGFINRSGKEVVPCKFDYISLFADEGVAIIETMVGTETKQALVDSNGKMLTPLKYDHIDSYDDLGIPIVKDGKIVVMLNDKSGVIDINGRELLPCKYDNNSIRPAGGEMFIVRVAGKYGVVNSSDKEVIPIKYDSMEPFNNGLSRVELNGRTGFVNIHGDEMWFK